MSKSVEEITSQGITIAIIVRDSYEGEGISFFTNAEFSQQLAHIHHGPGKIIEPHVHNSVFRKVEFTQEVLIITKGAIRVDLYDNSQQYLESRILKSGDVILLAQGGHGFEVIEDCVMFEVKQGPYNADNDKTRFQRPEPFVQKNVD